MTIHYRDKVDGYTLEMTDDHALAMWIALSQSVLCRLQPLLAGRLESVTFTRFDAKLLSNAVGAWHDGALDAAEKKGIVVHNAPSFADEKPAGDQPPNAASEAPNAL